MNCENNNTCCISDVLRRILALQKQNFNNETYAGCNKPFLGPTQTTICYNTRPIMLYNCCTGEPWSFTYTSGETTATSSVFRIESVDDCCCTCRILATGETDDTYTGTNEFFTIDLNCVGAIRCLADISIDLCQ